MTLNINGKDHPYEGDSAMPLLWVLRDVLNMTGTKYGCGVAACGACTVHLDGVPTRTCVLPVSAAEGKRITTIEGIGTSNNLSAVQKAWIEHQVAQCGYCQPGQLMSAMALLAQNASPTDEDIDEALSANLCRCGTYARIRSAVKSAARRLNT